MGSRGWNGATVVLTPVFEKGEYSATVNVKDAGKGTAGAFSIGGETYRLAAMGADGYAFDYWLAGESSSPIYENPYTVTLTENTNFTAYFRERRVPTVNAETNGTAAFTYENSSGGADQYTLTATPDELYVFDYWSWEGVPTGAENSAPEEQALPDEDMPEDGGEAEPPAESPEPAPPSRRQLRRRRKLPTGRRPRRMRPAHPRKSLRQPSPPRTGRRMPPGRKRLHPPRRLCCA